MEPLEKHSLVNTGLRRYLGSFGVFWHWMWHLGYDVQASWMFVKCKIGTKLASLQAWAWTSLLSSDHGTFWESFDPQTHIIIHHTEDSQASYQNSSMGYRISKDLFSAKVLLSFCPQVMLISWSVFFINLWVSWDQTKCFTSSQAPSASVKCSVHKGC